MQGHDGAAKSEQDGGVKVILLKGVHSIGVSTLRYARGDVYGSFPKCFCN